MSCAWTRVRRTIHERGCYTAAMWAVRRTLTTLLDCILLYTLYLFGWGVFGLGMVGFIYGSELLAKAGMMYCSNSGKKYGLVLFGSAVITTTALSWGMTWMNCPPLPKAV